MVAQALHDQALARAIRLRHQVVLAFQLEPDVACRRAAINAPGLARNVRGRFQEFAPLLAQSSYRYLMSCLNKNTFGSPSRVSRMKVRVEKFDGAVHFLVVAQIARAPEHVLDQLRKISTSARYERALWLD